MLLLIYKLLQKKYRRFHEKPIIWNQKPPPSTYELSTSTMKRPLFPSVSSIAQYYFESLQFFETQSEYIAALHSTQILKRPLLMVHFPLLSLTSKEELITKNRIKLKYTQDLYEMKVKFLADIDRVFVLVCKALPVDA